MEAENTKHLLLSPRPTLSRSQDSGTWPWYAYLKQELEKSCDSAKSFQVATSSFRSVAAGSGRWGSRSSSFHPAATPAVLAVGKLGRGMASGPNKDTFIDAWTLDLISHPSGNGKFTKDLQ